MISTIMVKDGKVRIEDAETASEGSITIFDSAKGLRLVVVGGVRGGASLLARVLGNYGLKNYKGIWDGIPASEEPYP